MSETLLTPSGIKLYGRVLTDLRITYQAPAPAPAPPAPPTLGDNTFLKNQLVRGDARLARIYGFSFEGHYYDLPKPAIFLVHTDGSPVDQNPRGRSDVDTSGVVAREWEFAATAGGAASDLRYWEYDKGDFSIRMDVETGPFEQILLAAALRGAPTAASGADLRSSGADLRISGADLRIKR
jgi:hypothetical protein